MIIQMRDAELRRLARETYKKVCIGRPHMPHPDSDEGQRKIDRLYDIVRKHAGHVPDLDEQLAGAYDAKST